MARHTRRNPVAQLRKLVLLSSSHKPIARAVASALAAMSGSVMADNITPDGRTGTSINVLGEGFSEITTTSVKGSNAFNSFSNFELNAGNTVNFVLPSGTSTLVNLVTDSAAIINGTVNSVFEGAGIGGHLVFADPHGIVVGASGVLNVGSLLLTAPTQSLVNGLLSDVDGELVVDDYALDALLSGSVFQGGTIDLQGTVNAFGDVLLAGQMVVLGGQVQSGTDAAHATLFSAAVNTSGLKSGNQAAIVNGRIVISAESDVQLAGTLDVSASAVVGNGGSVEIRSAGNVTVASTASIAARGAANGNGGSITLDAAVSASVGAGATIDVSGDGAGNGGSINFQGAFDGISIEGVNLLLAGGPGGNAGTLTGAVLEQVEEPESGEGPLDGEGEPEDQLADEPADAPAGEPEDQLADEPEDQLADGPADEPAGEPEDQLADEPGDEPADEPEDGDAPMMFMMAMSSTSSSSAIDGNSIETDGRTGTLLEEDGNVTTITTTSVMGSNAFNSFSYFELGEGNVVNFILPVATSNLINLVTDAQAIINGTINSYLEGVADKIAGHIIFADPHGIVVGANGVLNVGSLLLSTPTTDFMDAILSLVDEELLMDEDQAMVLLRGQVILSSESEAVVQIDGVVSAYGAIHLEGNEVILTGAAHSGNDTAHAGLGSGPVVDGRVSIRSLSDVTISGTADASSAAGGGSAGMIRIDAGSHVDIQDSARLLALGASDGGNGGQITVEASGNVTLAGEMDASGSTGASGNGGSISVKAAQDLDLQSTARLAVRGGLTSGNAGTISLRAGGSTLLGEEAELDASARGSGKGGKITLGGSSADISGLATNLAGAGGGADGELLISAINVSVSGNPFAYYTNGGDVTINAGDRLVIESGVVINTRRIDNTKAATTITPAYSPVDNPSGLVDPTAANSYSTASEGDSGNVTLQAPHITVKEGARIFTFATDGFNAGNIELLSGSNVTCNICTDRAPGDYFSSVSNVANTVRIASTDDVSITIENDVTMDARYVDRADFDGAAGDGGDITLLAEASDKQLAGWSNADASVKVNSTLRGRNVSIEAKAQASVNFGWLAGIDPEDPTSAIGVLEEIGSTDFDEIHNDIVQNFDDPGDLTNLLGIGLPVTAGLAQASSRVEVGGGAEIEAAEEVMIAATAERSVNGSTGGLAASLLPPLGIGVIYGEVSGTTEAIVSGDAKITAGTVKVVAESTNEMEISAEAEVEASKDGKGNQSAAFSLAIGRASVKNQASVGEDVSLSAFDDTLDVEVRASNVDEFTTEATSTATKEVGGKGDTPSQGAMTVALSMWKTTSEAEFNATVPVSGKLDNLQVEADNISVGRVTKATVQTGNNLFNYITGDKKDRKTALDGLVAGGFSKGGKSAGFRLAAAAAITISDQIAEARIGSKANIDAAGDVTVTSRVVNQGVRNIADSRVNSAAGKDAAKVAGSVAVAVGFYNHDSNAIIEGGAVVRAEHVGVGSRVELPVDNDYDEAFEDFDVTQWESPGDFFGVVGTLVETVMEGPDAMQMENFGLADYLLTSYSNAYGDAEEGGTSAFGSANATIINQNSRAWIGEGASITARAADGEWETELSDPSEGEDDELDLDTEHTWTWGSAVDVSASSQAQTISVVGNLSLLTIITNIKKPDGKSVGGALGWTEFNGATIAGIADGALVKTSSLNVAANTQHNMWVVAPSAGHGDSVAGNGIFSLAQMDTSTHASISNMARIEAESIDVLANHDVSQWSIGGAVAVSSGTSIGVAVAVNSIETDTRAWIGANSDDRPDGAAATASVPGGLEAGILAGTLQVSAMSEGEVGAIAVAGAVAQKSKSDGTTPPAQPQAPQSTPGNNSSLTSALNTASQALSTSSGGSGGTPGSGTTLTGAGSGTLNFSSMNTIAEVRDVNLLHEDGDDTSIHVRALADVDEFSASGAAAISLAGADSSGRSVAVAGAVAFNEIDNTTRAGIYRVQATKGGQVNDIDVLAASSGDALSLGLALAVADGGKGSGAAAAISASIGTISIDTVAEIADSTLDSSAGTLGVTAYDRSRILAGGGALALSFGKGGGGAVGLAATYGSIDNDVSAYIRGSELSGFKAVDVTALGASRILAGAFGGGVSAGPDSSTVSGAGSLYIMTLDSDINAGITASYGTKLEGGETVTDYSKVLSRSDVSGSQGVTVSARSSKGLDVLGDQIDALFDSDDERDELFAGTSALSDIDSEQVGFDPLAGGLAGEAFLGIAGSLSLSGGSSAGFAIGFADLGGSYIAEIRDADVEAAGGNVVVEAINSRTFVGVAAGASVSGSGQFSALGSGTITLSDTEVKAQVLGASKVTASLVDVHAQADGEIITVAGAVSVSASGSAAIGAAVTYNELGGEVTAQIGGTSTVTATGSVAAGAKDRKRSVNVQADQDQDIYSVAVAGGVAPSGTAAVAGSVSLNLLTTKTQAIIDASSIEADSVQALVNNGDLADRTSIWSLAGSVTASSNAGFGVAFAFNNLSATYDAKIDGVNLVGTTDVRVNSNGASGIRTLAASGGGSGNISAGISDASSIINNQIGAYANYVTLNNNKARVDVSASDDSSIGSLAGAVQVGSTGGVGIAAAVNAIGNSLRAEVKGGSLQVENLLVDAATRAQIQTISVGVAAGGTAGIAGSISVNLLNSSTFAGISGGANIVAENNVGVNAVSEDSVDVIAGAVGIGASGVGIGASVVVNDITSSTKAGISGSTTKVSALAKSAVDTLTVRDGDLQDMPNVKNLAAAADFTPWSLKGSTKAVTGLAVNAQSLQSLGVLAITVGVDGTGVGAAITATTNIVGGETAAYVDEASVNIAGGANSRQDLDISASSHAYTGNMAIGLAVGTTGGGSATAAADVVSRRTEAYASGADLRALDAVTVNSRATLGTSMLTAGGAAGGVGAGAGSGSIVVHEATTLAYLDGGTDVEANSLAVKAKASNAMTLASGAIAGAGAGAAAAAIDVAVSSLTTEATVTKAYRDTSKGAGDQAVLNVKSATISAESSGTITSYAVGGAGAGAVGVGGSIAVNVLQNSTIAKAEGIKISNATGAVNITAKDSSTVNSYSGALGGGGAYGIGAGIHVTVVHGTVNALLKDSEVTTAGALNVKSDSVTEVESVVVAAGIGGTAGISGAVSVAVIGKGERSVNTGQEGESPRDADEEMGGSVSDANAIAGASGDRTDAGADKLDSKDRERINKSSSFNLLAATASTHEDTTTANISGGTIKAGSINVLATDSTHLSSTTGALAIGGIGVGGAVAIDRVYNSVEASVTDDATLVASGNIKVEAVAKDASGAAIDTDAVAGAAGIVGIGAAVVDGRIDNVVLARVDATVQDNSNISTADINGNTLVVSARDTTRVDVNGMGAAAGAGAAGIVVANAGKTSTVDAAITGSNVVENRTITVAGYSEGGVKSKATAASAGAIAVNGTVSTAIDETEVDARVSNSSLVLSGSTGLKVHAEARPNTKAEALGVSVGAYGVGASVAVARSATTVDAVLGAGNSISGTGAVDLRATVSPTSTGAQTTSADATGATGGYLVGVNATVADASSDAKVNAKVESGTEFKMNGAISISASNTTSQHSSADSFSAGLVAVGANVATAKSTGTTAASFAGKISGAAANRDLAILALGNATNSTRSEAGNGGVIAGAASSATNRDTSTVTATLGSSSYLRVGDLDLSATHVSNVQTSVNSVQASLVGMSGSWGSSTITGNVSAIVAEDVDLDANNIGITARGEVRKANNGHSVVSGSGGAFNAAAAENRITATLNTKVDIGNSASLGVVGSWKRPGVFNVLAENVLDIHDSVKLDAGGAIAVARARSIFNATLNADINVRNAAVLESVGALNLGTRTDAVVKTNVNAKTYGAAGAAQGESRAAVTAGHNINILGDARLQAYGNVTLAAGRNPAGAESVFDLQARTDLWNKTAFPVKTDPDADAVLVQSGNINIANNADVASVADVFLTTDKGNVQLVGKGVGKDLYREVVGAVVNGLGKLVGAGELSLDIHGGSTTNNSSTNVTVDGTARAGIYNHQYLTVNYNTQVVNHDGSDFTGFEIDINPGDQSEGVTFTLEDDTYTQLLFDRLEELYKRKSDYGASAVERAAFQSEINLIEGQLLDLGRQIGLADAQMIDAEGNVSVPSIFPIKVIRLDDIIARPGNVEVMADNLKGSGVLDAPGDASIKIINHSPAFVRTGDLTIPDREGGQVKLNRSTVHSSADINAINQSKTGAMFDEVNTALTSPAPVIQVINNFDPADLSGTLAPDLFVDGNVLNRRGSVELRSNKGSVIISGDVRANSTTIGAGENVVLSYIDSFRHIGTDPSGISSPDPDAITVAGNSLIVSARYINVNGVLQSGIPNWTVVVDMAADTLMTTARNNFFNSGGQRVVRIAESNPVLGSIGYRYDALENRIILDSVEVAGGYMELTGKIMSTGAGEIRVLDGYGRVKVENNTGRKLDITSINLGSEVEGKLRINDAGYGSGHSDDQLTSTIYTRVGNKVQVYQGEFSKVKTTSTYLKSETTGRDSFYDPKAGLDYIWLAAVSKENKRVLVTYRDKAIGFIPSGSGSTQSDTTVTLGSAPVDASDYLGQNMIKAKFDTRDKGTVYDWGVQSIEIDEANKVHTRQNWTSCQTRVLGICVEKRAWQRDTWVYGTIEINRRGMKADNQIAVKFIGNDSGDATITSLGDIVFSGSLLNASGATTVKSTGGSINMTGAEAVIEANTLNLDGKYGVGNQGEVRVQVGSRLDAKAGGDININAVQGNLNIGDVTATGNGDVTLRAQGNLTGTGTITGDAITLESRQGAIGTAGSLLRIDTGNNDTTSILSASAPQGVHVREVAGDLRVHTIDAAANNVSITVSNGALLDANTTQILDDRLDAEIQAMWDSMGLVGTDAAAALAQELASQERAGQSRYERYFQLRNLQAQFDVDGTLTGYSSDTYDPDYVFHYTSAQGNALADAYGWLPGEKAARIAEMEQLVTDEYHELYAEFGGAAYDSSYAYELGQDQIDAISEGYEWTEDQLKNSIARGLVAAPGASTGVFNEPENIIGRDIVIYANSIGKTLDEDIVIDLSGGVRSLSAAEKRALATAEYDDVAIDPGSPDTITIIQRDDVDLRASGHITAIVDTNAFIGGEQDINLYNVDGQAIRIKTDGSVTTARVGQIVLQGTDVILEGSSGNIGSSAAPIGTAITGELTARTNGEIHIDQSGDLLLDRVFGGDGVYIDVSGNLLAARPDGAAITGGPVDLQVTGNVGSSTQGVNLALGLGDKLSGNIGGNAWLGAEQGVSLVAGNLDIDTLDVAGRLHIADTTNLLLSGATNVGGLTLNLLGNWTIADAASLTSKASVAGNVAGISGLRNISVSNGAGFSLQSARIDALGTGFHLDVAGAIDLDATGNIGASAAPLNLGGYSVDATSLTGNVYLNFMRDTQAGGNIAAIEGSVVLDSEEDLTLDTVYGDDGVEIDVAGNLTVTASVSSAGSIDLSADHNIDVGLLEAGDSAFLYSGGDTIITLAQIANLLDADAVGSFNATKLQATNIVVDAGSADISEATAGDAIAITTVNEQLLGSLLSKNDTKLRAGTDITIGDATTTAGNLDLHADGNIDAGTLDSGDSAFLYSGGDTFITLAQIANLLDADAVGSFNATKLQATNIVVDAGSADISEATAGDAIAITTVNEQLLGSLLSKNDTRLRAGTDITIGDATTTVGNLDVFADGNLVADKLVSAASAFLYSGGDTTVTLAQITDLLDADAVGNFSGTELHATTIVVDAGSADIGTATAGDTIDITTVNGQLLGSLLALNDITLDAGTDITLNDATSTAGNLYFHTGGNLLAVDLSALINVEATIGGNMTATNIDATDILIGADSVNIDFMTAGSDIRVVTVGDQDYLDMEAVDLIELIAGGNITFRDMRVGDPATPFGTHGDVFLDSGGDIAGNLIYANRDVGVSAIGDFRVNEVARGGSLDLTAGRNVFARVGGDIKDIKVDAGNDVELHALGLDEGSNGDILLESLKAGGMVTLGAAGDIRIQPVDGAGGFIEAGGGADLTAGGDIEIDRLTLGGSLVARAANVDLDEVDTGGDQRFEVADELRIGTTNAGGSIDSNSGGVTRIDAVTTGQNARFVAQGLVDITSINSGNDVEIDGSVDVEIDSITSGGNQQLFAGGNLLLETLDAGGNIDGISDGATTIDTVVSGGFTRFAAGDSLRVTSIESGGDTKLDGGRDIVVNSIKSGGDQLLDAATTLDLGLLAAGGDIDSRSGGASKVGPVTSGGSASFRSGGLLDIESINSGAFVNLLSDSSLEVGDISAGGNVDLSALGLMQAGDIESGGAVVASGQSDIATGDISSGGEVIMDGAAGIETGDISSGSYLFFTSAGDLVLGKLVAGAAYEHPEGVPVDEQSLLQDGVAIALDAGNNMFFGNVVANGDVVTRSAVATVGGDLDVLGNANFLAGGDIRMGDVVASGDVDAEGFNLDFASIDSGSDVSLNSLGDTFVFSISSLGNQEFRSLGDIDFEALLAGGYIDSVSVGDTRVDTVHSDLAIAMNAGMEWSGIDFGFTGNVVEKEGDLFIGRASAPMMILRAGNGVEAGELAVANSLDFYADRITANIVDSDDGTLALNLTGGNGELADHASLFIETDGALHFSTLYSREADIETNSNFVVSTDTWLSEVMTLQTGQLNMLVNQVDRTARKVDVQLYEEDHRFEFTIDGMEITTDAYVVAYAAGYRTWVPNYIQSREEQELMVQGPSAEKYSNTVITQNQGNTTYVGLAGALQFPALPAFTTPALTLPAFDEGAPVNLQEEEEEES